MGAVFLLVVLAGLAVYLGLVSRTSQASSAGDFLAARAYQAARAGVDWGAYRVMCNAAACNPGFGTFKAECATGTSTRHLTFSGALADYTATVECTSEGPYTEGPTSGLRAYTIRSVGCNLPASGACPNASTTSATYAERELRLTLVQ
jgi:MSHA biogenesis protein MshP